MKKMIYIISALFLCMYGSLQALCFEEWELLHAAQHDLQNKVKELINANVNVNAQNYNCQTALMLAAASGHTQIVKLLLYNGANVNGRDVYRSTALIMAIIYDRTAELVNLLLQAGASVNDPDNDGRTPLMRAAENGRIDIVQKLLQAGAKVNYQDKNFKTALICAVISGCERMVDLLLQAKPDLTLTDDNGRTVLIIAAQLGHTAIINPLLQAGADIAAKDWCCRMTAYEHAVQCRKPEIADLLQIYENMLKDLDRQVQTYIEPAQRKLLGVEPVDETVISGLIKYFRPILVECLNWEIIKENDHKKLILDKALIRNDTVMIQALIASGFQIPKNILKKPMCPSVRKYLEEHLARVETLYGLRLVREEERPQNTLGLLPKELMSYLVSELAIADSSLILMLMAKTRTAKLLS